MSKIFLKLWYLVEYTFALLTYLFIKIQFRFVIRGIAYFIGSVLYLFPGAHKIINSNIRTAFPEKSNKEVIRIGRASIINTVRNIMEFLWMTNSTKRIEKCTGSDPYVAKILAEAAANDERVIFVNPHLGSWEASGLIAPYYFKSKMAAIANPLRNPYLNKLFNDGNRKKVDGLHVIFSKGAVRATLKALRQGFDIGILIDQNTKVREGGAFVNFFGLPVPCSKSPEEFVRYGLSHDIKIKILFGVTLRHEDGVLYPFCKPLLKPEADYEPEEMIQELISTSEEYIRKHPEQYLWFYKRFAHIPQGIDENLKKCYPYYAKVVKNSFYSRAKVRQKKKKVENLDPQP
jgi:KDO2-lipid IV(A) lauroyltransferase